MKLYPIFISTFNRLNWIRFLFFDLFYEFYFRFPCFWSMLYASRVRLLIWLAEAPLSTTTLWQCPNGERFLNCGTSCPPTCHNPNPPQCPFTCSRGCYCVDGLIRDQTTNRCVPPAFCFGIVPPPPISCQRLLSQSTCQRKHFQIKFITLPSIENWGSKY